MCGNNLSVFVIVVTLVEARERERERKDKIVPLLFEKEEEKDTFGFKNHRIKFLLNSYSSSNLQNSHKVEQLAQYVDKFQDFSKA